MKKVLFVFALALGAVLSSFTTRVASTQTDYVWFDVRAQFEYLDFGTPSTVASQHSLSESGGVVAAIGYLEDKEGIAYTIPGTEQDPVIMLDEFDQPQPSDADLFEE